VAIHRTHRRRITVHVEVPVEPLAPAEAPDPGSAPWPSYDPGFTTVTTPLEEVLQFRRGVCQDFAHLAVGCVRSMGLAARYVSGYLETRPPAGEERVVGADASHAWPSVFIPGWGWLDLDPTNDKVVGSTYVTTAWGRDYAHVSPLKGIVFGGGDSHTLDVAVDVSRSEAVDC
jgi:transglutaminase-like putative cysteine protease